MRPSANWPVLTAPDVKPTDPGAAPVIQLLMTLAASTKDNAQRAALYREAGQIAQQAVEAYDNIDNLPASNGAAVEK